MSNEEFSPDIYTLEDEEGNQSEFELIDQLENNGNKYFAMMPYYENPEDMLSDDGNFIVLKSETIDGEDMLITIDDDDEYNEIGEMFIERNSEMFEDDDE